MKKTLHKMFWIWQFEEEREWLNQMAQQGWILYDVGFCTYKFEQGEKDKYQFALEILNGLSCNKKNKEYISFVEQTGAEYVGKLGGWVYFKKEKNENYDFDMYSDNISKAKYLKRLMITPLILAVCNLEIGVTNCFLLNHHTPNNMIGIINFIVAGLCGYGFYKIYKKRKELLKENSITQ